MKLFKKIRQQITKRRKPPKAQSFQVPACDYNLLRFIRISLANGSTVEINSADVCVGFDPDQWGYYNAKILHDYYDMNQLEVIDATGFHVEEK